jgi:hypothetical protein
MAIMEILNQAVAAWFGVTGKTHIWSALSIYKEID